jgi:iron uptake system component EfeO
MIAAAVVTAAMLASCAVKNEGDSKGTISVTAKDSSCDVERSTSEAGNVTFNVTNKGNKVTEFYVYASGDRIMGEVENIGPGLSRKLIVELPAGKYQTACKPGMRGNGIRDAFNVTGKAVPQKDTDSQLKEATQSYQRYINTQIGALEEKTVEFVNAVKASDTAKAKQLYPVARTYYERIEPVAESFGELDPAIDEREDDPSLAGPDFTGFHRLEKALWQENNVSSIGPVADKLLADVKQLAQQARTVNFAPLQLANGSKGLLDEVAKNKITGEEDRYSHTDLWDFAANVDGSKAAVNALRPVLQKDNPDLLATIDERFTAVGDELAKHQKGDGYKLYNELSQDDVKELSTLVTALGEVVGQVSGVVAQR